jgi:hypothetical protein
VPPDLVLKTVGVSVPLVRGRSVFFKGFGLMPQRKPINVLVGAPIDPPPLAADRVGSFSPRFNKETREAENGDARMVDELHHKYVAAVKELYQKYKAAPWNRPGIKRTGTLKVIR